jgi:hypothetical protein
MLIELAESLTIDSDLIHNEDRAFWILAVWTKEAIDMTAVGTDCAFEVTIMSGHCDSPTLSGWIYSTTN